MEVRSPVIECRQDGEYSGAGSGRQLTPASVLIIVTSVLETYTQVMVSFDDGKKKVLTIATGTAFVRNDSKYFRFCSSK